MEQNVARSRTCGEVLWCEVRFFFRVFSRVFLRHPFLHIREVSPFLSSLSVLSSALLCPSLPSSSLLPSSILFSPLPFPSLLFLYSPLLYANTNTTTNIIRPLTPNLQPIKCHPALLPSTLHPSTHQPINPTTQQTPILPLYTSKNKKYTTAAESIPRNIQVHVHQPPTCSLSIPTFKKSIVLQQQHQTLLQQVCRVTFSGSSGSSSRRKSQSIYYTCNPTYVLFYFVYYQAKGKYEDEAQLAQFLCLYLPTFQEIYRITATTTELIQHKPTYRFSGRRFSGRSFSGSSGSSKSNRNLPAYRRNPIFLSFLSFSILN